MVGEELFENVQHLFALSEEETAVLLLEPDLQQRLENDHLPRTLRIAISSDLFGIFAVLGHRSRPIGEQIGMIADLSKIDQSDKDLIPPSRER